MAMHFIQRLIHFFLGEANRALKQSENPEDQLVMIVDQLDQQLREQQQAVASALADEKRLRRDVDEQLTKASEWESRAFLALDEHNDESLAREALAKKEECETVALALQKRWEAQKAATEKLKTSLQQAKERVADARRQHTLLIAQYKSVETKQRIHASLSTGSDGAPMAHLEQLAERIRRIEAETDANLELNGEAAVDNDLEARFVAIEQRRRGDQALEALKSRMIPQRRLLVSSREPQLARVDELKAKLERS